MSGSQTVLPWVIYLFIYSYFDRGSGAVGGDAAMGGTNDRGQMYAVKVLRVSGGLGSRDPALDPYQQVSRVKRCFISAMSYDFTF